MQVSVVSFVVLLDSLLQVLVGFRLGGVLAFKEVPVRFRCLMTYGAYVVTGWAGCMFGGM